MIAYARLAAERAYVLAVAPGSLPPVVSITSRSEDFEARARRMWRAGRSVTLIWACTGLPPHEVRAICADLERPFLSAGGNRPSEASREATVPPDGSSLTSRSANAQGLSHSTAGAVRP